MADVKEGVKFTEEEMEKINEFKGIYDTITISYGRLAMDKLVLEDTEKDIKTKYNETRIEEQKFVKSLSDKYGQGNLNMETGVFIPVD